MKKLKVLTVLFVLICTVCTFTGCGATGGIPGVGKQADSPEEFAEMFIRSIYIDKVVEPEDAWNVFVSNRSKELGVATEEDYTTVIKKYLFANEVVDVMVSPATELQDNIYKVVLTVKCNNNGNEATQEEPWYIINEDGRFGLLVEGAIDMYEYDPADTEHDIDLRNIKAFVTPESIIFNFEFMNNTDEKLLMGPWVGSTNVNLKTDKGNYTCSYAPMQFVAAHGSDTHYLTFEGAEGKPSELYFDIISIIGRDGLPVGETSYTAVLN